VQQVLPLIRGDFEAVSQGLFAVLRPFEKFAAAVLDLAQGKIAKTSANDAVDVYRDVILAERATGELALYKALDNAVIATVSLPRHDLEDVTGFAVSPDLQRVAISTPARGAIWNLRTSRGEAMMPPFTGGAFGDDGRMFADFLPWNGQPRQIATVDTNASRLNRVGLLDISRAYQIAQIGRTVFTVRPTNGSPLDRSVTVDVRDVATLAEPLWTKTYQGLAPRLASDLRGENVALYWPTAAVNGRERLKNAPALLKQFESIRNIPGNYLLELLDVTSGTQLGTIILTLGHPTTAIASASIAGDYAVIADTRNRIHIYSLSAGEVKGQLFGRDPAISAKGDLVAFENGPGRLFVYDLSTLAVRAELRFRRRVTFAAFNESSSEILVVTADQSAARLAVPPRP
jgi:hypothetical protein